MINLTNLLCGMEQSDEALNPAADRRPVVVWNLTRRCNSKCTYCDSSPDAREFPGELNWVESRNVIDNLAAFGVPALLLSGGEPLMHPLFFYIAGYARERGLRLMLSTNGTLITEEVAKKLQAIGFAHVAISLDGIGETHDRSRGGEGAFKKAVAAFRNCTAAGQKVGLRVILAKNTVADLDRILDFIDEEDIPRVSFYHPVPGGRGSNLSPLSPGEVRAALDKIMDRAEAWHRAGKPREVITMDQPADGPYLLMRLEKRDPVLARKAHELLLWNGGGNNGSGVGIANLDPQGNVHPDRFWQTHTLGNVRNRNFNTIWQDTSNPILRDLRKSPRPVKGRCANCRFLNICGGGFRSRAWHNSGDLWAEDSGCYLSDAEIAPAQ